MANASDLRTIPGIGARFVKDFARIGITRIAELRHQDPRQIFERLVAANAAEHHPTSKNYLYVIRMAVYFANGGRDHEKLRWNAWKD
jgi:DNA-binding winged helix-turn-helix (wHTH) protein